MRRGVIRVGISILVQFICFGYFQVGFAQGKIKTSVTQDTIRDRFVEINSIYIIGNDKTKPDIITRELYFKEGEKILSSELDAILESSRNNVYNTNLFSTVELTKLQLDSSSIDVMIKLEERWYIYPSVVFRLIDRNFNDWWVNRNRDLSRTKYGVKLDVYNMRGRKEKLKLIALFGFEKNFIFQYSIPYIEKSQKHGLAFGGGYFSNKNIAYKTTDHFTVFTDTSFNLNLAKESWSGSVVYTYRPSFYDYHYLNVDYFGVSIADTIALVNPNYLGDSITSQNAFKLSYTFRRDTRDNRNYPSTGYSIISQIEKAGLGVFGDVDLWRLSSNYFQYYDLGKGFFANLSLGGQLTTSKDVAYFNYSQFGLGTYYVRGYELDVIEGPQNILTKNSLRKRLFATNVNMGKMMPIKQFRKVPFAFYAKFFADAGYVNNYPNYEQSSSLTNRWIYGVGLGLDIVTLYDLTFRFEYSYNAEDEFNFFLNFQSELNF